MKSIYGIDLGTTNSIVTLEGELITELVPSIVSLKDKDAGAKYKNDYTAKRSFKVDMTVHETGKVPIISSGLVLRKLVQLAAEKGHIVENVVVTVPAYFSETQRAATIKAAELIKLNVVGVINEPTAAAIAIAKEYKGLYVVYDLGGGTFDISIIDSRFGIFDVLANDGTRIGGDNIDNGIVEHLYSKIAFRRHLFSQDDEQRLTIQAERAKIHISNTDEPYVFNLEGFPIRDEVTIDKDTTTSYTLTPTMYESIVRRTLRDTAMRTRSLIEKHIAGEDYRLAMVGGSTKCRYVTKFIEETLNVQSEKLEYDPDTIVAEGASIYAMMIRTGEHKQLVQDVTKGIGTLTSDGTIKTIIPHNSKTPISRSSIFTTDSEAGSILIDIYQGDSILAKNSEHLGSFEYELSKTYSSSELSASINIEVTIDGLINITVKEPLQKSKKVTIKRNTAQPLE